MLTTYDILDLILQVNRYLTLTTSPYVNVSLIVWL